MLIPQTVSGLGYFPRIDLLPKFCVLTSYATFYLESSRPRSAQGIAECYNNTECFI